MESAEQTKLYTEEDLREKFFKLKERFDVIESVIGSLYAASQEKFVQEREEIKHIDEKREYSEDLKKLISSDTDYRNNKLLQKIDELLLNALPQKRNTLYMWGAVFVIVILQIITFGISS
jgi:type IV secretory pathway component VirB8